MGGPSSLSRRRPEVDRRGGGRLKANGGKAKPTFRQGEREPGDERERQDDLKSDGSNVEVAHRSPC